MSRRRFVVALFDWGPLNSDRVVDPLRRRIEDDIKDPRDDVEIDLWLESTGGDANAAYKLALLLRAAAAEVRVVIPDYAKSAGTLLALVGNPLYMAPAAELGPLDPQLPEEGRLTGCISGLSVAGAGEQVATDALELANTYGPEMFGSTGLTRLQTLDAVLHFASRFYEPLVRQLDARLIHEAKQTLRVAEIYALRLLRGHCDNADEVARSLVHDYPSHDFVISIDEARSLGLPVRPIEEYDLLDAVRTVHRHAESNRSQPLIQLMSLETLLANHTGSASADDASGAPDEGASSTQGEGRSNDTASN